MKIYCKEAISYIKEKIEGKDYSELFVVQASDSLVQNLKSQFKERMLPQKKEINIMSPQIWKIELK